MVPANMITDGGQIYAETDLNYIIAEPWNAVSSLAIVAPAVYWAIKLRKHNSKSYWFMWFCIPLLILGGTGSTLFHGFRNSQFFLMLDILPTAVLTLSIGIYFWLKVLPRRRYTFVIFIPSIVLRYYLFEWFPNHTAANVAYFVTGSLIFIPLIVYLYKTNWFGLKWMLLSISMLAIALFFREIDTRGWFDLPMGTHFLWHIFSGVGAYFLAMFLYNLRKRELVGA